MNLPRQLSALVVHESMFENTATIAEAVARGLELEGLSVTSVDVAEAPDLDQADADLLVVGAPTHAFSLSRPSTREDAVIQGAPAARAAIGVREWLEGAPTPAAEGTRLVAVFDTRIRKMRHVPKSAGTRGDHLLRLHGFTHVVDPEGFVVEDLKGPLLDGETARAVAWGREIAQATQNRFLASTIDAGTTREP